MDWGWKWDRVLAGYLNEFYNAGSGIIDINRNWGWKWDIFLEGYLTIFFRAGSVIIGLYRA